MARGHWLVKSEPSSYAWERFVSEGGTRWDGVRNPTARRNLGEMKQGEPVLFYHSGEGKEVVGLARVAREAYPDPADVAAGGGPRARAPPRPAPSPSPS